ncbi:MAG TPA: transglutaminase family protein [Stellaceae bacterium]|nr:transglutaminase family protein [Stellaceae bacterium]
MSTRDKPEGAASAAGAIRFRVRHVTDYRYQTSVVLAHHLLHLKPRVASLQTNTAQRIMITPKPLVTAEHEDCFGNPATYIAIQEPHVGLTIESELEVERKPPVAIDLAATPAWETLRDKLGVAAERSARLAAAFAYSSPRIASSPAIRAYAASSFVPGRPIGVAASALMKRIHDEFIFDPSATTISTPVDQVLAARRGVCQDFAQLQIACLRSLGLPARYVSGYLRTEAPDGGPRLQGADASHAWLSVWCGGDLWLDLDPTNDQLVGSDYVTLAWGRDYDDVSPVRGVLFGGGANHLTVRVDVEPIVSVKDA